MDNSDRSLSTMIEERNETGARFGTLGSLLTIGLIRLFLPPLNGRAEDDDDGGYNW
jgi:hypothetical protein